MSDLLRFWVDTYYDFQKLRIQTGSRIGSHVIRIIDPEAWNKKKEKSKRSFGVDYNFPEVKKKIKGMWDTLSVEHQTEFSKFLDVMSDMEAHEKQITKEIELEVTGEPIWTWLSSVKGVGPIISAGIISGVDIRKADHPSSLWKYCGLSVGDGVVGVADKRKRGEKISYNPRMKVLMWKLGESFVKSKGEYRQHYERFRAEEERKNPEFNKMRHYLRAKRKTVKLFLSHLYVVWRGLEGLPVSKPYCEAYLEHKSIPPSK